MSTRLYPIGKPPNEIVYTPLKGQWAVVSAFEYADSPYQWTFRLQRSKEQNKATRNGVSLHTNQQGNFDMHVWRFMTYPLQAMTLTGTMQLCFMCQSAWDTVIGQTNDSIVHMKVHAYISIGQTAEVRQVILDNYVHPTRFDGPSSLNNIWQSFPTPQSVSGTIVDGDTIVVEMGIRVVSSPTPVPTYPPGYDTLAFIDYVSPNIDYPDAVAGAWAQANSWIEFSADLVEKPLPPPPPNCTYDTAIVIPPDLPYTSPYLDTTQSTDVDRRVWYKWIAPKDGLVILSAHGSNYQLYMQIWNHYPPTGSQYSTQTASSQWAGSRSLALYTFNVTTGTTYWFEIISQTHSNYNVKGCGGMLRLNFFYREPLQVDDLYLAPNTIFVIRDGKYVNMSSWAASYAATGLAIDYTKRPIKTIQGAIHADERLILGLFGYELGEMTELNAMKLELDYLYDWYSEKTAQLYCTKEGLVYSGFMGNGFLYVAGAGSLPALLSDKSYYANEPDPYGVSHFQAMDSIQGDFQLPGPNGETEWVSQKWVLPEEYTESYFFDFDEDKKIVYYTSGGLDVPVNSATKIKRFNVATNTAMPDFATLTPLGNRIKGLRGLKLLVGGGLLVCNGNVVQRLDSTGAIIQTYTPSIPMESNMLHCLEINHAHTKFWVLDYLTTKLYCFDIASGAELWNFQVYGNAASMQLVAYDPEPIILTDISGIYFINPNKTTKHDSYYNDIERKIPDPTIRTSLLGE